MAFNLTACGPEDPTAEMANSTPEVSFEKEQNTPVHNSIETLLLNTPIHISKVFSENFKVEANVQVPKVKKSRYTICQIYDF